MNLVILKNYLIIKGYWKLKLPKHQYKKLSYYPIKNKFSLTKKQNI